MADIIKIGEREVGEGRPVFVIAEAGINHNGKLELAKKLVDATIQIGADAIKFQTYNTEALVSKSAPLAPYQKQTSGKASTQYEMLKRYELKKNDFIKIYDYCVKTGIVFLSTPHDEESMDFLVSLGVAAIKIASGDATNIPFLERASRTHLPLLVSTGMSSMQEVGDAAKAIRNTSNKTPFALLHCVSSYPAEMDDLNLRVIPTLRKRFKTVVGLSDHTGFSVAPVVAVALGAKIIEKHLTLERAMEGPDHNMSLEPQEFRSTVAWIREAERSLGSDKKIVTRGEYEIMKVARKSLVASKYIPRGTKITKQMLAIKRPGTGIPPGFLHKVIGRYATADVSKDSIIEWRMLGRKRR